MHNYCDWIINYAHNCRHGFDKLLKASFHTHNGSAEILMIIYVHTYLAVPKYCSTDCSIRISNHIFLIIMFDALDYCLT